MRTRGRQNGSGLIEFALGFSVLVVLAVGLAQIAFTMVILNQLGDAVRAGARYAATTPVNDSDSQSVEKTRNMVVFGNPSPRRDVPPLVTGLRPQNVSVNWTRDTAGVPTTVTVSIRDFSIPLLFRETNLDGRPSATARRLGPWTPTCSPRYD